MNNQNFANRQFFTPKPKKEQKPCFFAVGEVLDSPQAKVFVSGITKLISDEILKKIFEQCGEIFKWKRTEDADGNLQPFLFCEYVDAQSSVKAVKFLNNFKLGDKRLNVKMDDKDKKNIIEYLRNSQKPDDLKPIQINEDGLPIFDNDRKAREEVEDNVVIIIKGHYPEFIKMPLAEDTENNKDENNTIKNKDKLLNNEVSLIDEEGSGRDSALSSSKRERERRHSYDSPSSDSNPNSPSSTTRRNRESTRRSRSISKKREIEDSDEEYEKRKLKQIMKEKEEEYQKRLRRWEEREEKQAKVYKNEEKIIQENMKKEKKQISKMLRFLEDYDDEKDDERYYSAHIMSKIRRDYDKQKESDLKDKEREEKEIKELRKIASLHQKQRGSENISDDDMEVDSHEVKSSKDMGIEEVTPDSRESPHEKVPENNDNSTNNDQNEKKPAICLNLNVNNKRVQNEAFDLADDEDDDGPKLEIKKKLKIFEVTHEERMQTMTQEEKSALIKGIVNNIPKDKEELFKTPVLWEYIDKDIIANRIKPYVDTKVQEYLGDKEETFVEFILEKVAKQIEPENLLNDIKLVLEEDAEVFTIKLWRLIIYEAEANKIGIV
uniref:RRM domain-containing protein n=1 Tax=Parastrongyloides trichosuri TaxID=131310 RepID=A0A0N4ZTH2_PARTI